MKDASGKLQGSVLHVLCVCVSNFVFLPLRSAFGFCEYALPESTLRAIRLLDGLKLGEKALVVS